MKKLLFVTLIIAGIYYMVKDDGKSPLDRIGAEISHVYKKSLTLGNYVAIFKIVKIEPLQPRFGGPNEQR